MAFSPLALAALIPIGLAWTVLLAYLDSDAKHRSESVELIRAGGWHNAGALQELQRYQYLSDIGASQIRREFVVLLLLSVSVLVALRKPRRTLAERLPAASIALGLLLLAITPSKWIWHFGGLVGVVAVAIGFESHRLAKLHLSWLRRSIIVSVVIAASLWAAIDQNAWGPLDFGQASWLRMPILYVAATAFAAVVAVTMGRVGGRAHLLVTPAVAVSFLGVTVLTFATASATTDGWTAARQSLSDVAQRGTCGLASDIVIPTLASMRPLSPVDSHPARSTLASDRAPQMRLLAPRPAGERLYRLPEAAIGVFVSGSHATTDTLEVVWARTRRVGYDRLRTGVLPLPPPASGFATDWIFVSETSFPNRPPGANAVIIDGRGGSGAPSRATITRPVTYGKARLSDLFERGENALVDPFLFEATPCAPLPDLVWGVAEPPSILVEWHWGPNFAGFTSPFRGIVDAFDTVNVPLEETDAEGLLVVHWAVTDPRDAVAPATRRVIAE